jgi:hypothetical protein
MFRGRVTGGRQKKVLYNTYPLMEDAVLALEETFTLYGMSLVNAYSD